MQLVNFYQEMIDREIDDVIGEFESFTRPESGVIKAVIEVT